MCHIFYIVWQLESDDTTLSILPRMKDVCMASRDANFACPLKTHNVKPAEIVTQLGSRRISGEINDPAHSPKVWPPRYFVPLYKAICSMRTYGFLGPMKLHKKGNLLHL